MQKTPLTPALARDALRGMIFGIGFALAFMGSVIYAANTGGEFGAALNKILASGNWQDPGDGTVKNAKTLDGRRANEFVKMQPNQQCEPKKCIYGIESDGRILCR